MSLERDMKDTANHVVVIEALLLSIIKNHPNKSSVTNDFKESMANMIELLNFETVEDEDIKHIDALYERLLNAMS